jgi:hypothetical protein
MVAIKQYWQKQSREGEEESKLVIVESEIGRRRNRKVYVKKKSVK